VPSTLSRKAPAGLCCRRDRYCSGACILIHRYDTDVLYAGILILILIHGYDQHGCAAEEDASGGRHVAVVRLRGLPLRPLVRRFKLINQLMNE
jgi:hypothetical protein